MLIASVCDGVCSEAYSDCLVVVCDSCAVVLMAVPNELLFAGIGVLTH